MGQVEFQSPTYPQLPLSGSYAILLFKLEQKITRVLSGYIEEEV